MSSIVTVSVNVQDLAKLAKKLHLEDAFKDGLAAGGIYVKGVISEYPPASAANSPKPYPGRWYERGYGTKWYSKTGILQKIKSSETLGKRWTSKSINGGMGVEVGNNASYAVYVQSRMHQAAFHKIRGWSTAEEVVENETEKVLEIISDFIQAKLEERKKPSKKR